MHAIKRSATLTGVAALTLLTGCAVGPDFKRPEPPRAERYVAEPAQAVDGTSAQRILLGSVPTPEWWQLFRSDTLDQVVQRALDSNRTLAAATASLAQAQELANARAGQRLPQVGGTAGTGRQKYGAQFLGPLPKPPPFTYFAIGATVSYALDYTGGIGRSIEQQRALAEYQQHQLEA